MQCTLSLTVAVPSDFIPELLEVLVEWFSLRDYRIFSESVQENSITTCPRMESFAFLMPQTTIELNIYPQI